MRPSALTFVASLTLALGALAAGVQGLHALSTEGVTSEDPDQEEILVLAKLNVASIKFTERRNRLSCKVVKKTGDRDIDRLACKAVENCYFRHLEINKQTLDCIPSERIRLVREYVSARQN